MGHPRTPMKWFTVKLPCVLGACLCVCVCVCVCCVLCYPESLSFQSENIAPFDSVDNFTSDVFCLHIFTLGNSV